MSNSGFCFEVKRAKVKTINKAYHEIRHTRTFYQQNRLYRSSVNERYILGILNREKFLPRKSVEMSRGNSILVGSSRLTVDLAIWYQPGPVQLYFSLILMCSVTSRQCLQQTGACLWSPLCQKMPIVRVHVEL